MGQFPYHVPRAPPAGRSLEASSQTALIPYHERGSSRRLSVFVPGKIHSGSSHAVPTSRFKVRVTKDYLVFCSGHFITYDGDHCERLHGHNYRASVEITGELDDNHYVFDFIALKTRLREITDQLDHRMLVPTKSRWIACEADD